VARIEVDPEHVSGWIRGSDEIGRVSLSAAKITIHERLARAAKCGRATRQRSKRKYRRRLNTTEIMYIRGINNVTGSPVCHDFLSPRAPG
jgi:hypothetical protein